MLLKSKLNFYIPIFIFILMIYRSSWFPGAAMLSGKEIFVVIFAAVFLLVLNFDFERFFNYQLFNKNVLRTLMIFVAIAAIISILFYNVQEITKFKNLFRILAYLSTAFIFLFVFPKFLSVNRIYINKFLFFLASFGLITALFGFITINSHPVGKYQGMLVSYITHPNNTSIIFTFTIPATIYLYYSTKSTVTDFQSKTYLVSIIIQIFAQLFTFTRAGMIATFVGILVFMIFKYKYKLLWFLPIMVPFPFLVSGFFSAKGTGSFFSRLFLLVPAYFMITEDKMRFLWGYGLTDAFVQYRQNTVLYNITESNIDDPHNSYVSLMIMLGFIGTITILGLLGLMIFKIKRLHSKTKNEKAKYFCIFSLSFLISLLIQGLFDSELVIVEYYTIQFFLAVIGINYILVSNKSTTENSSLLFE